MLGSKECDEVEYLYNKYKNITFSVAKDIVKDEQTAEDIVHQTFERAIKYLDRIPDLDSPRTKGFLCIMCRNLAINEYNRRKAIRSIEDCPEETGEFEYSKSVFVYNENVEIIKKEVNALPSIYKDVIKFTKLYGFSVEEASETFNTSQVAIRKRVQRAKEMLAMKLKDEEVIVYDEKRR